MLDLNNFTGPEAYNTGVSYYGMNHYHITQDRTGYAVHVETLDDDGNATPGETYAAGRLNIHAAHDAQKTHPRTARGSHEHAHAKIYFMRSPDGQPFEVQNLIAFIAEHPEYFPNAPQARKQLYLIARSHREPNGNFRHQYSYHGWTMTAPPMLPEDVAQAKAYRAELERKREQQRQHPPGHPDAP